MKSMRSTLAKGSGGRRKFTKWQLPNSVVLVSGEPGADSPSGQPAGEHKGWILARADSLVLAKEVTAEAAEEIGGEFSQVIPEELP